MIDEYTPTTDDVENCYVYAGSNPDSSLVSPEWALRAEFTRWIAAHDREVAAGALRDAAALVYADWSGGHAYEGVARQEVEDWLCDRADRIEKGASDGEQ